MKGSEAQKQRPHKLLWMLWFDGKSIPKKIIYLEELIVFKDFSAVIIHWTFGFGQPLGAAQEIPKGRPSSTSIVCGGSSLKLNSSDLRTKTELVMAVPYLFLAKHWYWPKRYETANTGEWIQTESITEM